MRTWEWQIHYKVKVKGLNFEDTINFSNNQDSLEITLENKNRVNEMDDILFKCIIGKAMSENKAKELTLKYVNNMINIFADKYGVFISKPFIVYLCEKGGNPKISNQITLRTEHATTLDNDDKNDFLNGLKNETYINFLNDNIQQKLYRDILFSENKVGNFIAMYGLLTDIIISNVSGREGQQKKVDDFIRSQPEYWIKSEDRISTLGNGREETKYTWFRNQIGHAQLNTLMHEVENEIEKIYPGIVNLVNIAIKKYYI